MRTDVVRTDPVVRTADIVLVHWLAASHQPLLRAQDAALGLLAKLSFDISVPAGATVTDSAGVGLGVHQLSSVVSFTLQLAGGSLLELRPTGEVGEAALLESLVDRPAGVPAEVRVLETVNHWLEVVAEGSWAGG